MPSVRGAGAFGAMPMMAETNRIPAKAGWCSPSKLPRGPNGRALCRQCGSEVPKGSRSFCSTACVHSWKLTTDPGYQRKQVFERDRGVCSMCGLDTEALLRAYHEARQAAYRESTGRDVEPHYSSFWWRVGYDETNARLRALGFIPGRSCWEMDHVLAVVEGGGGCSIDNLRTLCVPCHRKVTRELRARRSKQPKLVRRSMR